MVIWFRKNRLVRPEAICLLLIAAMAVTAPPAQAGFVLGDAGNFAVLYTGGGGNQFQTNNSNISGNIGIGSTGTFSASGGCSPGNCIINGNVEFDGPVNNSGVSGTTITGTITGGHTNITTDLSNLSTLSSTLGTEGVNHGTVENLTLTNTQTATINASDGYLDANGNRVFFFNSFNLGGGSTLTINRDTAGDSVVFDFASNVTPQFAGAIVLTGLTDDQVLYNLASGQNLSITTNGATENGDFLDPNGTINVNHSVLDGRLFGGDSANMQIVSGFDLIAPPSPTGVPEPSSLALLGLSMGGLVAARRQWSRYGTPR